MFKLALIYTQYDSWAQPYIAAWEKRISELGVVTKPFLANYFENNKVAPRLFCRNKKDLVLRIILAFFFSLKGSLEYVTHASFSNIKIFFRDIADFYPLISFFPDVIHFIEYHGFVKYMNFLSNTKIKSIVSFRGGDILVNPWSNNWSKDYLQTIFLNADKLHFVSKHIRDEALKLGAIEDKCFVLYPSVDTKYFSTSDKVRNEKVRDKIKLATVGRLVWEKGIDYALAAMRQLVLKGYSLEYNIIGDGPDLRRLQFLRHKYELDEIVHFLGKQPQSVVKDVLIDADIYLQPSLSEAICVAIMEASSMKLPIVATNVGGIPELVMDGENGFLVQSQNSEKIVNAVETLIKNEPMRLKMGEKSREIVEQKFSLEEEILNWKRFYSNWLTNL